MRNLLTMDAAPGDNDESAWLGWWPTPGEE